MRQKIRVLEGVRNDRRKDSVLESQTVRLTPLTATEPFSTVQSPAPLGFVLEGEVPASVGILLGGADRRLVDVPLHDVPVGAGHRVSSTVRG